MMYLYSPSLTVSLLLGLVFIVCTGEQSDIPPEYDFRIVNYEDHKYSIQQYSSERVVGFVQMTVDPKRNQLLLGARNYILRLSLEDLQELEKVKWASDDTTKIICKAKGQTVANCHNFIRVLLIHNNEQDSSKDQVFTCGTNAFDPKCSWRQITNLRNVSKLESGISRCPYNPLHNSTSLMTKNKDLYAATVMDFTGRDPAIYRNTGPSTHLRTMQYNSKWLNDPEFVSSYEIGDMVYFFFREPAVEYINCGKTIYSRVARVCKNDQGGNYAMEHIWTTFLKARLNCSLPGEYPFYFNEIQSTFYVPEKDLVYTVFSTPPNSIYGSAVCVYNMTAFNKAFAGSYKFQDGSKSSWEQRPNKYPNSQCDSRSDDQKRGRSLVDAQQYQMMDEAVQPITIHPMFTIEKERWIHIAVDTVAAKHHKEFEVIFVASLEGLLRKLVRLPNSDQTCFVEEIHLFPKGMQKKIQHIKIYKNHLYVSTESEVLKVPVQRCNRFKSKQACSQAMDPYCGWNAKDSQCAPAPGGNTKLHFWHQKQIKKCPVLNAPVDGEWSDWSVWTSCGHIGLARSGDQCLCRTRACNSPLPRFGGKQCSGDTIQVTNCTSNGKWTDWSPWSGCSQTCGTAVRMRSRQCSSPTPKFGGRVCVGQETTEEVCINNPPCPVPQEAPVDGQWSKWGSWTDCTANCGGGVQRRYRACDNPEPSSTGRHCIGNDEQWRMCNTGICTELRKSSEWTPWMIKNDTVKGGYYQQRFKVICKANVQNYRMLQDPQMKKEDRFCLANGDGCQQDSDLPDNKSRTVHGGWSSWSEWSTCDAECNGGMQWRERECNRPTPNGNGRQCEGLKVETRECNTHSCQGVWSCWSEFSECSATCGVGTKFRIRTCDSVVPGKSYTKRCRGSGREEKKCEMEHCPESPGWEEWTVWSVCDTDNNQRRQRKCNLLSNGGCEGASHQTRMCNYNEIQVNVAAVTGQEDSGKIEVIHLVIVGLAAFLLGGVIGIALFIYIRHFRNNKYKQQNKQNNKVVNENKPHLYPFPSVPSNNDLNNRYYSNGSLNKGSLNKEKLTVKEATLKRNSLMRTNLSLTDQEL